MTTCFGEGVGLWTEGKRLHSVPGNVMSMVTKEVSMETFQKH